MSRKTSILVLALVLVLLPLGVLYARPAPRRAQAVITLDGQRDAGYVLLAQDLAGDLADPGPGEFAQTVWTDLTNLYATDDGAYLYIYVDAPDYAQAGSTGEIGLAIDTTGDVANSGGASDPWGNPITFAYTSINNNVGQTPTPTVHILFPDVVIRGNIPGVPDDGDIDVDANNGWTELRVWDGAHWSGGGVNWGGIPEGGQIGTHVAFADHQGIEFKIPFADLGVAAGHAVHLEFYATQKQYGPNGQPPTGGWAKGAYDTVPSDDQSSGWDDPTTHIHLATYGGGGVPDPCAGAAPGDDAIRSDVIYHNNLELAYRDPIGPVPMDVSATLRLQTCHGDVQQVQVLVWKTGQTLPVYLDAAVAITGAFDLWQVHAPPPDVFTDQWYQFKVVDGNAAGFYHPASGNTGPGVWYTGAAPLDPSWSLPRSAGPGPTPWPTSTPGPTPTPAPQCGAEAPGDSSITIAGLYHLDTDPGYRDPLGDIQMGQAATLTLRTCENDVQQVSALVWKTGAGYNPSYIYSATVVQTDPINHYAYWNVVVPSPDVLTDQWYQFKLSDGAKVGYFHPAGGNTGPGVWSDTRIDPSWKLGTLAPPPADYAVPSWMQDAVIYQIFPDRFRNGNASNDPVNGTTVYGPATCNGSPCVVQLHANWLDLPNQPSFGVDYYGGDLQGVIDKINEGYFNDLGVNTLYFNPIFDASSNHGYDTNDYYDIRNYFGNNGVNDNGKFDELVAAANAHNLRIILDAVFNHTGSDSRYMDGYGRWPDNGACESANPYRAWFTQGSWGQGVCADGWGWKGWYGYETIPELQENDAVKDFLYRGGSPSSPGGVPVVEFWMDKGIAGWRFDVAQDITPGFFDEMNDYIKHTYGSTETLMLGEVTGGCNWDLYQTYVQEGRLDSAMNYCFRDWAVGFANGGNPSSFDGAFNAFRSRFPDSAWHAMMNLISSHDSPRALNLLNGDKNRLKLAALLQMTLPGAPSVYYGDEVALAGGGDPDNRRTYPWADEGGSPDMDVYNHFRTVIGLRNAHSALRGGDMRTLLVDDANHLYSYIRWDATEKMVVALNNGTASRTATVPVASHLADGTVLTDTLNGGTYTVAGGSVVIPSLLGQWGAILAAGASNAPSYAVSVPAQITSVYAIAVYPVSILNTGGAATTFDLAAESTWGVALSESVVTIEPGLSAAIALTVEIPLGALPYTTEAAMLTVSPQAGEPTSVPLLTRTGCRFDFDSTNVIDVVDVLTMVEQFGGNDPYFDMDHSGAVDINDIVSMLGRFGQACP